MPRRSGKSVTLQDLSRMLGLSTFTISKALSGKEGMSEETRERVIEVARKAGYRWKGEQRRSSQTRTIALVLPSRFLGEFSYFADLLQGAEAAARQAGAVMAVVGISSDDESSGRFPSTVAAADGAIYLPMLNASWLRSALRSGPPAIVINFAHRSWAVDSVVWDAQSGIGLCVDHLIERGYGRIGYVGAPDVASGYRLRWVGFQEALREYALSVGPGDAFFPVAWPPEECLASVAEMLRAKANDLPPAFVCDFETTAVAVLRTLAQLGRTDIAVACGDQLSPPTLMAFPVPHIDYHRDQVGRRAVERLLQRLEAPDDPHEHIRVAVSLRVP